MLSEKCFSHFRQNTLIRVTNMVDAAGTTKYAYTAGGQLWTEDGPFASDTVTNTYQNHLRTALSLAQPTGAWTNGFGYDAAKHLTSVTSPAGTFTYVLGGTSAASPLIQKLGLPNTSYITNTYDTVARLTGTWLKTSANSALDSATYGYNVGNQRTTFTNTAGTRINYTYDRIGQVKVADSSVNTEDRGYVYDAAWNLAKLTNNGTATSFTVDGKNQLVTDPLFYDYSDNNGNLQWQLFGSDPWNYTTSEWVYKYVYDDENRLTSLTNYDYSQTPYQRTDFTYDGLSRLRKRDEYTYSGTVATLTGTTEYIYDGMRVIQERDASNVPTVSYTRGTDLSSTMEGAGGIGGLLARSHGYSGGNWSTNNYYHADGNGNITYLENSSQTLAASYRYDAYGNTLSSSGTLAAANVYRFSSKEIHVNTGLYYYGFRWYMPSEQRWLNRDPIEELGGVNLYTFIQNRPSDAVDFLGLSSEEDVPNHDAFCAGLCAEKRFWGKMAKNPLFFVDAASMIRAVEAALKSEGCPPCDDDDDDDNGDRPVNPTPEPVLTLPVPACRIQLPTYYPSQYPGRNSPPWSPGTPNLPAIATATGIGIIILLPWPGNPIYGGA